MDKIILSEEMKKSIIKNTSEGTNKKTKKLNLIYLQRAAGLAACFIICLLSYHVATDYGYTPSNINPSTVNTPMPENQNTDNTVQNAKTNQPIQGDVPTTVKNDNVSSHQSQAVTAHNAGDSLSVQIDNIAQENSSVNVSDCIATDTPPLVAAENPSVGDIPILGVENPSSDTQQIDDDKTAFEGNPIQNIKDTEQIEKELGYSIKTPEYIPEDYQISDMCVIAGIIAQITYESDNDTICYRTAKGNEDISGDYNVYSNVETININNSEVTMQGDDNLCHKASWTNNDEVFSVCSDRGIEKEIMIDIVESVN